MVELHETAKQEGFRITRSTLVGQIRGTFLLRVEHMCLSGSDLITITRGNSLPSTSHLLCLPSLQLTSNELTQ